METKRELCKKAKRCFQEMEKLEETAKKLYGEEHPAFDTLGIATTWMMNACHEVEETLPKLKESTLQQLFDLLSSIKLSGPSDRSEIETAYHIAVRNVSKSWNKERNTIADICVRRLDLNGKTEEFIDLVEEWILEGDDSKLKKAIKANTDFSLFAQVDSFFIAPVPGFLN